MRFFRHIISNMKRMHAVTAYEGKQKEKHKNGDLLCYPLPIEAKGAGGRAPDFRKTLNVTCCTELPIDV